MMKRSALLALLSRYEARTCTPAECQLVEQWYELLGEPIEIPLTEQQWLAMEEKLWRQVQPQTEGATAPIIRPLWRKVATLAASIAAVIIIGIGLYRNQKTVTNWFEPQSLINQVEQAQWTQFTNQTGKPKQIKLPDGSIVVLWPKAQLAMHKDFNQKTRDVRLLGEASFQVHRDPGRPFLVYSGDIITKVLGTSFRVRTGERGQPIQVTVQSGKVTVYRQGAKELTQLSSNRGVILTPNQKATYFPDNEQFVTSITEDPQPIVTTESAETAAVSLEFEDTPIGEVIRRLERIYGTEIELEQESLSHCPFTGNLTQQALYTKLELLCGTINGSYEVRGTKILITGKGCQ